MGPVRRFTLLFRERWWAEHEDVQLPAMSFLFAHDAMPPVWWTAHPWETRTITGWIGGPRSAAFAQCTREQIGDLACAELAKIFSLPLAYLRGQLIGCATHDWQTDPLSCGAYSYVPVGALDAVLKMATPVRDTLYFAGEHTDVTGHWGTVHAAMRSGLRAAKQVLSSTRAQVHEYERATRVKSILAQSCPGQLLPYRYDPSFPSTCHISSVFSGFNVVGYSDKALL